MPVRKCSTRIAYPFDVGRDNGMAEPIGCALKLLADGRINARVIPVLSRDGAAARRVSLNRSIQ